MIYYHTIVVSVAFLTPVSSEGGVANTVWVSRDKMTQNCLQVKTLWSGTPAYRNFVISDPDPLFLYLTSQPHTS